MTYYLKKESTRKGLTHICDDSESPVNGPEFSKCACDNQEHLEWEYVRKGLKISMITCKDCLKKLSGIVEKELKRALLEL